MMRKIFTILFLFISLMVQATDRYIATAANGGSNSNNGSSGSPWLTLTYACANTTSGDIIHVGVGTFTETSRCALNTGVSIIGAGVTSVIKSGYAGSYSSGLITATSSAGNPVNGNQSISYIKLDGNSLTGWCGLSSSYRYNVSIHHCIIINYKGRGISIANGGDFMNAPSYSYSTGNSVHDCTIINCGVNDASFSEYADIWWYGQTGFLLYNNTMTNTAQSANADCIKCAWTTDSKIYNNVLTKPTGNNGTQWNFFSELFFTVGGMEIYGNTLNGNASLDIVDIRPGSSGYGCKVYNNSFLLPAQDIYTTHGMQSIDFENWGATQDVYVYNNYFKNVSTAIQFDGVGQNNSGNINGKVTFQNIYVYYNIFENTGNITNAYSSVIDIKPEGTDSFLMYDHIYIDNNTIISGPTYKGYSGILIETCSAMTNIYVRNNIIQGYASNAVAYSYNTGIPSGTTHYIQDNLFYNNSSNSVGNSPGVNGINYTPSGGNVSMSNPLFVSTTDFHLTSGSPAIGAGIHLTTPSITTDYDSVTIGNPPDIGAYEFISNHPPSIQDQGFQLNEYSPEGTSVGTVVATDPEAGQMLTYSIVSGNTNGAFAIDALTGMLSVVNGAALTVDFSLVVKVQDNGVGELSSQATISIEVIPTGIKLTGNTETIKVYPNPVSDELIIEIEGNKNNTSVEILNLIGQVVFEGNLSEKTIVQTSNFSLGVYLIKLQNGKSFEFKKIIKL
jgi:hypothetical protein